MLHAGAETQHFRFAGGKSGTIVWLPLGMMSLL